MKNIRFFLSEIFHFLVVKFSGCLNRHVFVMLFFSVPMFRTFTICSSANDPDAVVWAIFVC